MEQNDSERLLWNDLRLLKVSFVGRVLQVAGRTRRWSDGRVFNSRQEWRKNFLPQSSLSVPTLIWCRFHRRVTARARKKTLATLSKVQVAGYSYTRVHTQPDEVGVR